MWHHALTLRSWSELVGLLILIGLLAYGWRKWPKTVPEKIRALRHLRGICPERMFRWQARVIERAYDSELAEARAKNDAQAATVIRLNRHDEAQEYWGALEQHRSLRLAHKAQEYGLPFEELVQWISEPDPYGNAYLTPESHAKLRRAVIEEERKTWEFRLKIIGALTGLVGALIGLAAFLTRKP